MEHVINIYNIELVKP